MENYKEKAMKVTDQTILQLETNSIVCLEQKDIKNSEMYARMAEGARCVRQNLEELNTADFESELVKLKEERDRYLNIAYNAINLGQLDEQYSVTNLCRELNCTRKEYERIMS